MTNENMADVAVEVSCILERFPASYMKKIPQDFIDFINSIKSNTYTFSYDENISFNDSSNNSALNFNSNMRTSLPTKNINLNNDL